MCAGLVARLAAKLVAGLVMIACWAPRARAQTALTWQEVQARFQAGNPALLAGQISIDEARAAEITAYLRPNPQFSLTLDQIGKTEGEGTTPFSAATLGTTLSYLHERRHKRELRLASAQGASAVAVSNQADLRRTLTFTLRTSFVQVLQAKAFRELAEANLASYDQVLALSRDRLNTGDIAQVDFNRLQLQRVQYESDVQTSLVNLRTAKIQLRKLLYDPTPVEQFEVAGPYDFAETIPPLDELRRVAFDARPDLRAAQQAVDKARTDHRLAMANGSTDLTLLFDAGFPSISQVFQSYQPPLREFIGVGLGIPLRIFDRNQGEKLRTDLDIRRNERLTDATHTQVLADVESAYATLLSAVALLRPYRATYLAQATNVRDTITFSYQRGGTSLIDFLQAQQEYRTVQIAYVNLIASYLNAAAQLNLAVGQEVIQ